MFDNVSKEKAEVVRKMWEIVRDYRAKLPEAAKSDSLMSGQTDTSSQGDGVDNKNIAFNNMLDITKDKMSPSSEKRPGM